MKAIAMVTTLAVLFLAAGPSLSGAAGTRHSTHAVLSRALAPSKRSAHAVGLQGRVSSPYRPCRANRTVRFFHRVGGRDILLALSLDPDLHGYSRRPHHTSSAGKVSIVAKVANPSAGAYFMTVLPKTLGSGARCLGARSALRAAR